MPQPVMRGMFDSCQFARGFKWSAKRSISRAFAIQKQRFARSCILPSSQFLLNAFHQDVIHRNRSIPMAFSSNPYNFRFEVYVADVRVDELCFSTSRITKGEKEPSCTGIEVLKNFQEFFPARSVMRTSDREFRFFYGEHGIR